MQVEKEWQVGLKDCHISSRAGDRWRNAQVSMGGYQEEDLGKAVKITANEGRAGRHKEKQGEV